MKQPCCPPSGRKSVPVCPGNKVPAVYRPEGPGNKDPGSSRGSSLIQRFLPVFIQQQVGVDHAGLLIDGDGQDNVAAAAGIEDSVAGELQGPAPEGSTAGTFGNAPSEAAKPVQDLPAYR
jgi:hypothetical protein